MPGGELRQPLTRAQQAFWDLQEALPNGPVNVAYYLDLSGPLDISLLSEVGREFVARMATLFVRFETTPAGVEMIHDPSLDNSRTTIDFRDHPDPMAAAHAWMVADCARRIDLTRERSALFGLFRIADDRHLIYMRGHHIICDGAAAIANLNRWGRCYTQALAGEPPDYPEPADFGAALAADTDYAASSRRARDRDYWRENLADLEHTASLSRRYARPAPIPHRVSGRLDDATLAALREVETTRRTSLPAVVATAVAAYLSRMTGRPDVTVALPVAARTTAALRATPLPVSNVVPIRTRLDAGVDLATALERTQSSLLGALRHQRYRYEDIRADLAEAGIGAAGAEPGVTGPVLNLMLFEPRVRFGDAIGTVQVISAGPVDDLAITLYQQPREDGSLGAHIDLETNPGRYSHAETVDHFRRLDSVIRSVTAGLLHAPDTRVDAVGLLDPDEVHSLTTIAGPPAPEPRTLSDVIDGAVSRWPDRVAVEGPAVSWTYRDLARHSRSSARALAARGARPGTVVAIATGRGFLQTLSLWAVARTGAAVLLIDPEQPDARVTQILDDAQPTVTLTAADVAQRRPDWVVIEDLVADSAGDTGTRPVRLDDTAYLVYTSGTTGRPKGVALSHRGLAALVADLAARLPTGPVRIAQLAAPGFDATLFEHLVALATGGTVLPAPRGVVVGEDLASFLVSRHVTHAVLTPSVLATVPPAALDGSRLTTVMSVGEAISTTLAQTWASRCALHNLYGPAETTIMATAAAPVGVESPAGRGTPSIGLPITGTRAFVLDARLRPVPVGVAGDLYLAGPSLALGYPHDTPETSHRFVACPWGPRGARMYRTGDIAAWEPELRGLAYLGRADGQIQIRGVRVELGDIEAAADAHPDVVAAAAVPDATGGAVSLFVASAAPSAGLRAGLRRHLAAQLPPAMWPAHIAVLDALPITPTGKVDRSALASTEVTERGVVYVAPRGDAETAVAQAVSVVLGVADPSMLADVIELGGTSLTATRIAVEISTRAQVVVSPRDVLTSTTLTELAAIVDRRSAGETETSVERPIHPPASPQQVGLVLEGRIDPDSTANVLRGSVTVSTGSLSVSALRDAIADVVDRHEALRTIIRADGRDLWQEVIPTDEAVGEIIVDDGTTDELLVADVLDPTASVPVRVRIVEHADEIVIDVAAHHIVVDDRSASVLRDDVATAYAARSTGTAPVWTSTPLQYIDATLDAVRRLGDPQDPSSEYATQQRFWVRTLGGRDGRPRLPTDVITRDSPAPPFADQHTVSLPGDLGVRIEQLATESGVTGFAVLHTALSVVISRFTDTADIEIAVAQAGRDRLGARPAVGMYVNPVVLRTRIDSRRTVADLLRESAVALRAALVHSDIPFADVVRAVDPQRDITDAPLTDVWLSYRDADHSEPGPDGLGLRVREHAATHPRVPLQWNIDRVGDHLEVTVTYRTDRFGPGIVRRMVEAYVDVLDRATTGPDRTPIALLPGDPGDPVGVPPRARSLVAMFDETADRVPGRPALVTDGRSST
ncbi:non-ribosomal peptide synthetase, partial [Williamsia sp.]|uniref:non-ribosomal peptide synthetase n=1 Tax=Williamsia sp. TaxID=1872085 RepID=UPI001A1E7EC9